MTYSRVQARALQLMQQGKTLDKYDLATAAFCDQRTAQRALGAMHKRGEIHITKWVPVYKHTIPHYAFGPGKDAKKPKPLSGAEKNQKYLQDPLRREEIAARKRLKRLAERSAHDALKADPYGVFYRSVDQCPDRVLDQLRSEPADTSADWVSHHCESEPVHRSAVHPSVSGTQLRDPQMV